MDPQGHGASCRDKSPPKIIDITFVELMVQRNTPEALCLWASYVRVSITFPVMATSAKVSASEAPGFADASSKVWPFLPRHRWGAKKQRPDASKLPRPILRPARRAAHFLWQPFKLRG